MSDKEMGLLDHIDELRKRIFKIALGMLVPIIVSFYFYDKLFVIMMKPLIGMDTIDTILGFIGITSQMAQNATPVSLQSINPSDTFVAAFELAMIVGVFLSCPWIIFQIWAFVSPALTKRERTYTIPVVFFASFFFILGGVFAYFIVLPFTLNFLANFAAPMVVNQWSVIEYFDMVMQTMLMFGLVFEMPLLAFVLARFGILKAKFLREYRRYAIVIIVVLAAILTPPDVASQLMMAIPLLLLYELSIIVVQIFRKKSPFDEDEA